MTPSGIFKYPSSFAIATFSIILRPHKNIVLSYRTADSASCCTREIHEENAAIISRHFLCFDTISSSASPTFFSLIENPFRVEPVESDRKRVIPRFQMASILSKFAGSSSFGV